MKKIGILILVITSLALFSQVPGDEIEPQKTSISEQEVNGDKATLPPWSAIGPKGGYILAMAFNPKSNKEIYAITYSSRGGVYKTKNSGKKWTKLKTLNSYLDDIAVHPKNTNILYVMGDYYFYKSEDGGKTWQDFRYRSSSSAGNGSASENYYGDNGIALHPQNSNIIYVGGHFYNYNAGKSGLAVLKSTDGGENWIAIKLNDTQTTDWAYSTDLAINPSKPSEIYLTGYYSRNSKYYYRVYKSTDSGNNWKNISGGISSTPNSIAIDPTNPSKVYVGTNNGVYRSSNGGNTWTKNQGYVYCYRLGIDPSNPNTLYAGYYQRCYKSNNGGVSWTSYTKGLKGSCNELLIPNGSAYTGQIYAQSNQVFFGSDVGFYKSSDGGASWKQSINGMNASRIAALAVAPSKPNTIYTEVVGNGLFKSTRSGKKWLRLPDFYRCESIETIAINTNNPNHSYILAGG
jgi:photosystem II stability/assembly factor-like uncharacterized protein